MDAVCVRNRTPVSVSVHRCFLLFVIIRRIQFGSLVALQISTLRINACISAVNQWCNEPVEIVAFL